jgi:hypothetical protein
MLFAGRKDITGMRWLTKTGVGVEKVISGKFAKTQCVRMPYKRFSRVT